MPTKVKAKVKVKVRASIDAITSAAKHAATLPRLEYSEVREQVCSTLGVKFAEFDCEVSRWRKETRIISGKRISLTDAGNAQRFVRRNFDDVRSCRQLNKTGWFVWDGSRWAPDALGAVMELARQTAAEILEHAIADYKQMFIDGDQYKDEISWSMTSLADRNLRAMLNQAGSGTPLCVTGDIFDSRPELFNCQNGTINLDHTNPVDFYPARRADMLSMIAQVKYDPTAKCPKWEKFIDEALEGDKATVEYLQRVTGYLLTGSQQEQCFFLIQGKPGTGKSTFWRVMRSLLGDYFHMVSSGLFVKRSRFHQPDGEAATPGLVKLAGKRVAAEVELGEGDHFASPLLKRITGGESLTVRPLYSVPFTFQPQCKPVFLTNHQPGTDDFSGGLGDRLRIVKFNRVFRGTPEENKNLVPELCAESSGILNWAIEGLREYQKQKGLHEPEIITKNVEQYFEEENIVATWLNECAVQYEVKGMVPKDLEHKLASFAQAYATFKSWAERNEEAFGSAKWFSTRMKQLGHETVVDRTNSKFYQFKLLFPNAVDDREAA
jgi:putative DNA primase/helicase